MKANPWRNIISNLIQTNVSFLKPVDHIFREYGKGALVRSGLIMVKNNRSNLNYTFIKYPGGNNSVGIFVIFQQNLV